ncbi:hypothetical protein AWM70_18630 [Paenibacillus yonginensis]|uniref:Lipoprotein n=1 Tax=Paenibacillus yonginensis TaxID=1462996 RepID=A0A1B1N4H0_9BACL|nr:hypothetical protein [Paenibacillus yonginensis]ANS76340.1 hypothetical protein AWM70_18630 [Paenibacillus yonginensis]
MKKTIVILIVLLIALTACSKNKGIQQETNNQNVVAADKSVCSNDNISESNFEDYILCLTDNQKYSDVVNEISSNQNENSELLSVINTYSACMTGSALTDECMQVSDSIKSLYDKEILNLARYFNYVNRISDRAIAEAEADKVKAIQDFNEKYYNPQIGMTKEKVEESRWGEPAKINKTTTEYGVHEQWVYGGGRYVYFEDGIVTSIQE